MLTAVKLLLVMPANNATSERFFFPDLRRVKTYLRTAMTQNRLTTYWCFIFTRTVQTAWTDLMNIAREFVAERERRLRVFGDCRQ